MKINKLFASFASMLILAFAFTVVSPTASEARGLGIANGDIARGQTFDCIVSGDVYDYINGIPSTPISGATVTARVNLSSWGQNSFYIASTTTNGNGAYELVIGNGSGGIRGVLMWATASGYTVTTRPSAYEPSVNNDGSGFGFPCSGSDDFQLYFEAD